MSKYDLHILRHALSILNESGVIQGQHSDPGLSKKGKMQLLHDLKKGLLAKSNIEHLISSDCPRAETTAKIIAKTLQLKSTVEPLTREVNSGILAGRNKAWIAENYPDELAIWNRYGDLDGIEGAEIGDQLQARALAFLVKLKESFKPGSYGLVTHAAFMRSLVNTINGEPRHTIIEHQHLTPVVCTDVFSKIPLTQLGVTFTSAVYHAKTHERDYLIKRTDDQTVDETARLNNLLSYMAQHGLQKPFLFFSDYQQDGQVNSIIVADYLDGHTLLEKKADSDFEDVCHLMRVTQQVLGQYQQPEQFPSLDKIALKVRANLGPEDKDEIDFVTGDSLKSLFNKAAGWKLVDHDCHFGNFVRTVDQTLHKIDLSPVLAPTIYQPASALLSGFLIDNPGNKEIFERFLKAWHIPQEDRSDLIAAMKLRAALGISYFNRFQQNVGYNEGANKIREKYKNCFVSLNTLS